ncbi:sulfotransferase family 2 domain-containing protein, partial [Paraburkholderia sediminicola]|uniref:hypothetical protein n=1 Tax=Paraburkholderia sediminicola TaxID=458836 RepID=UPI0038BBB8DA
RRYARLSKYTSPANHINMAFFKRFAALSLKNRARHAGRPLAVMHIPKTAGTTVTAAIAQALNSPADVVGFDRVLFGSFTGFSSFDRDVSRIMYRDIAEMPDEAKLIMGHFARSTLSGRYPTAQLVTFLREPISRLLSYWLYWRCQRDEDLSHWGEWRSYFGIARGSLKSFLTHPDIACQSDNIVVRMLLWPDARIDDCGFIERGYDGDLLRDALARLESFDYTDIIENPLLNDQFGKWLGANFRPAHLNETPRVPPELRVRLDKEMDDETLDLLEARCRLDTQLWQTLAALRMPSTDVDVFRQRVFNRSLARYGALLAPDY